MAKIEIVGDTMLLTKSARESWTIRLQDIVHVAMYKRDEVTTDLICCEITVIDPDGRKTWVIHEDTDGFNAGMDWLMTLPDFDRDWWEKVAKPAFASCHTVVFQRHDEDLQKPPDA